MDQLHLSSFIWNERKIKRYGIIVIVLKFNILYLILFQSEFLCSYFLKYLMEWQTV